MAQITLNSTGVASNGSLVLQSNGTTAALTIDTSQRAAFVAGTAALPAITTTGDTNTGIFFPAADTIAFSDGGVEAMRLDASGNLGLNNTSPTTLITSIGGGGGKGIVLSGQVPVLYFEDTNGTDASIFVENGDIAFVNGTTEAARFSSGNLLVGATSVPNGTSTSGLCLRSPVSGRSISATTSTTQVIHFGFYNGNGEVGGIYTLGSATTFYTSSDYRLKNTITPMTGALAKVALLKPCTYKWNADGTDGQGFIAHELAEVVPDCVIGDKDAIDADGKPQYQGIDTSFLVATLTAAIQEQQALITQLQADVAALKGA